MYINTKYFNYSSINIKFKHKYWQNPKDKNVNFSNYYSNDNEAKEIFKLCRSRLIEYSNFDNAIEIKNAVDDLNNINIRACEILDSNFSREKVLHVLLGYGWDRKKVIKEIFGGNVKNTINGIKTDESLQSLTHLIFKTNIHLETNKKERLIFLAINETIYPLFVDTNHLLFTRVPRENNSDKLLENFFRDLLMSI